MEDRLLENLKEFMQNFKCTSHDQVIKIGTENQERLKSIGEDVSEIKASVQSLTQNGYRLKSELERVSIPMKWAKRTGVAVASAIGILVIQNVWPKLIRFLLEASK